LHTTTMIHRCVYTLCIALTGLSMAWAFSGTHRPFPTTSRSATTRLTAQAHRHETSRADFVTSAFRVAAIGLFVPAILPSVPAAQAAMVDESLKGTKKDPAYESCLSECMFYCTKPKGVEQKSRAQCLPECKVQCATTKEQLLKGSPKK
jgi:hypothetical protein